MLTANCRFIYKWHAQWHLSDNIKLQDTTHNRVMARRHKRNTSMPSVVLRNLLQSWCSVHQQCHIVCSQTGVLQSAWNSSCTLFSLWVTEGESSKIALLSRLLYAEVNPKCMNLGRLHPLIRPRQSLTWIVQGHIAQNLLWIKTICVLGVHGSFA